MCDGKWFMYVAYRLLQHYQWYSVLPSIHRFENLLFMVLLIYKLFSVILYMIRLFKTIPYILLGVFPKLVLFSAIN